MKYIFLCQPVIDISDPLEARRTPIAAYLSGREYRDMLSGDGKIIMTEVRGDIDPDVLENIKKDMDVLDCLELGQADDDDESEAGQDEQRKARRLAGRLGVPDRAIKGNAKRKDILKILRRRILISQALNGAPIGNARAEFHVMRERLRQAGFRADQIDNDDDDDELLEKLISE